MKKQMVKLFAAVALVFALSTPSTTGHIGQAIAEGLDVEDPVVQDMIEGGTAGLFGAIGVIGGTAGAGPFGAIAGGLAGRTVGAL